MKDVALWVFRWAPLLQLLPLAYVAERVHKLPKECWIVSAGFLVSFAANMAGRATGIPLIAEHYYPALQMGLFAYAFGVMWAPLLLIGFAMAMPNTVGPEAAVSVVGAAIVILWGRGQLRPAMWAFCGAATAFYYAFSLFGGAPLKWLYHFSELLGVCLFIHAARNWREA